MPVIKGFLDDLPSVMELVTECVGHLAAQGIDQWDEVYPDEKTFEEDLRSQCLYICHRGNRITGMIVLNEYQPPEYAEVVWKQTEGHVLVVHRLCVDPGLQRRGVATRLMDFAEDQVRAKGYSSLRLDAFVHNHAAVSLYKRREYRCAGVVHFRKGPFYCFEKMIPTRDCRLQSLL